MSIIQAVASFAGRIAEAVRVARYNIAGRQRIRARLDDIARR